MSTSKTITRTDLTNILNEVLPPADYSKVVEMQSFTALNKTWTFRRIGNIVFVDASADMNGSIPAGYSDIGTLNTSMCPKSNIYIQVGNATENAFLIVQPTGLVRFYHQTATSGAHNCGISGYGWIAGEGQLSPPPSPDCADYIVEQGTSGDTSYRKWNSGIAELWLRKTTNVALNSTYGNLYTGTWVWDLPFNLLDNDTNLSASCGMFKWGTGGSWGTVSGFTTSTITLRGFDTSSRASGSCIIEAYAKGKWK